MYWDVKQWGYIQYSAAQTITKTIIFPIEFKNKPYTITAIANALTTAATIPICILNDELAKDTAVLRIGGGWSNHTSDSFRYIVLGE